MEKIVIGRINKPHGVLGELRMTPYTEFIDERFKKGSKVYIDNNGSLEEYTIDTIRPHGEIFLIRFAGIKNVNEVDHLRNALIKIDYEKLHELPEGQYYFVDLIGLDVYASDEQIGVISEMLDMPAHPVIKIKGQDREFMVPYVEHFVISVDLENNRMDIKWMEGL